MTTSTRRIEDEVLTHASRGIKELVDKVIAELIDVKECYKYAYEDALVIAFKTGQKYGIAREKKFTPPSKVNLFSEWLTANNVRNFILDGTVTLIKKHNNGGLCVSNRVYTNLWVRITDRLMDTIMEGIEAEKKREEAYRSLDI